MTLGTPGKAGRGRSMCNTPADVGVADNGDIFVADGHANNTNNRVVTFSSDGSYIYGGEPAPRRIQKYVRVRP